MAQQQAGNMAWLHAFAGVSWPRARLLAEMKASAAAAEQPEEEEGAPREGRSSAGRKDLSRSPSLVTTAPSGSSLHLAGGEDDEDEETDESPGEEDEEDLSRGDASDATGEASPGAAAGEEEEQAAGNGEAEGGGVGASSPKGRSRGSNFDPYELLGLSPEATDTSIRSAFRKASLQVHPDRCPEDPAAAENFRELSRARDLLLDPLKRRLYDFRSGVNAKAQPNVWWSDWDSIFAELEPAPEAEAGAAAEAAALSVPRPLATGKQPAKADILIVGATGLTGTLACMLMQQGLAGRTWAIAGRDGRRLGLVEAKFGGGDLYRGSVRLGSAQDLDAAVRACRAVVDLTGPSHGAGMAVAEACVRVGRHYVDNSCEPAFSKQVRDKLHARAKVKGACLVMHAGECSLPVDFAVWRLVRHVRERLRVPTRRAEAFEWATGFVLSGTSYSSGCVWAGEDTSGVQPFLLGGIRGMAVRDEDKEWTQPMEDKAQGVHCLASGLVDRLVVRGTCGLMDAAQPYGRRFNFSNWVPFLDPETAAAHQIRSVIAQRRLRALVEEGKIPPPGRGPGERMRRERIMTRVVTVTADHGQSNGGERCAHLVMSAGPGGLGDRYEGTAGLALEAACALLDTEDAGNQQVLRFGWGTPVYHLAHLGFMDRPTIKHGLRIKLVEGPPPPELLRNIVSSTLPLEV